MAGQTLLLYLDGNLSVLTALPLHLCSFSGILCLPAMMGFEGACRFLRRLGVPGALAALLFPAMLASSRPVLSSMCFFLLHALLLFSPLAMPRAGAGGKGALLLALALLALALAANLLFGANYLFLRAIPDGTPFSFLSVLPTPARAGLWAALMVAALTLEPARRKCS